MYALTCIIFMYTGDVLLLGEDIRLKFNDPQEASFLRKKRRSEHRSMVILHCYFANISYRVLKKPIVDILQENLAAQLVLIELQLQLLVCNLVCCCFSRCA